MKRTLIKLWNGEICPWGEKEARADEIAQLVGYLERHLKSLQESLDDKGQETLSKLTNCFDEIEHMECEASFLKGFSLGVKIVTEALAKDA
ncbi:MAG: hypothetical protein E7585_05875 [Ruminococcaceae bacterium]|nr:hypothetical protein [Oscillospiraceae bacterium]